MTTKHKKLVKKIIAAMSIVTFGASLVNISEAAIGRIPSISSRTHGAMQDRNNDRFNRNRNNRRNDNQATAPKEDTTENANVNDVQPQESTVENKNENNNGGISGRRNEINNRKRQTPAKIVRDIDRSHDATYDEDDRYKAQRESYFEDDGNGRIVDEQREVIEDRRQISATESDRERGRETIINRYDDEDGRRGSRGSRGNRDNGGITVVVNNNIPIENKVNVDVKAENKNENKNDTKLENNNKVTSTNNNSNDNDNTNKTEANVSGGTAGGASPESKPESKPTQNPESTPNPTPSPIPETKPTNPRDDDNNKVDNSNTIGKAIWGDVNSDGKITADDHQLLLKYLQEKITTDDLDLCVADVNGDGEIDIYDPVAILNYLNGKSNTGKVGKVKEISDIKFKVEDNPMAGIVAYKPVIYLYPTEEKNILVKLFLDGEITCTYPKLNDCWDVTAAPDGTLTDKKGKHYNYLFWEGIMYRPMDFSTGFCVAGKDVEEFLQDKLSYMGMNEKEINDFMVYWLPQMQDNSYNIISFQKNNYVETAVLDVTPAPDTTIRVFMAWKKSTNKVDIKPQQLDKIERKGFTLVEWGGGEVMDKYKENKLE